MKKFAITMMALAAVLCTGLESKALFEDKCNPTPKCEPDCFGCAPNKPETLVKLEPCALKDKPYNYYTWSKVGEKEVSSDKYDWAASPAQ